MPPDNDFYYEGFSGPNGTIVPDDVFDLLAPRLKESELRVLLYIVRRTFGFGKSADAISLKQLTDGIIARDGRILDSGTGMSRKAVVSGIKGLSGKGIISVERRHGDRGDSQVNVYKLRFRDDRGVTQGNPGSHRRTPPPVTTGTPQDSVIQDSGTHNNTPPVVASTEDLSELHNELKAIGVHPATTAKLISRYDTAHIENALRYLIYRLQSGWQPQQTPAAWLVAAIKEGYVIPDLTKTTQTAEVDGEELREAAAHQLAAIEKAFREERRRLLDGYGIEQNVEQLWQRVQDRLRAQNAWSPVFAAGLLRLNDPESAELLVPRAVLQRVKSQAESIRAQIALELGHELCLEVKSV